MKEKLDILQNIQKVESPAFLYPKIIEKIRQKNLNTISYKEAFSLAIACVIVVILNIGIISMVLKNNRPKESEIASLARGMQLIQDNNLY